MRALLRNKDNSTVYCMEVKIASFVPEDNELLLENTESTATVYDIIQSNAEAAIRKLYADGQVDLTAYPSDY